MTASETNIPVIALPIDGSAMGKIDATFSMINMPPGIPNGFIADYAQAAQLAQHIMNLTAEDSKSVYISEFMQKDEALQRLIQEFGIEVTKEM
jgi:phosphoribosylcarboxyaminoimidazole (NCAIR) mutase